MTIPELPDDLVEEILCHVPAKSTKRLRSTSKQWKNLFEDRRFARKHYDKAAKQFQLLMLTEEYSIYPISVNLHHRSVNFKGQLNLVDDPNNSDEFEVNTVFHCDGLLLCTSEIDRTRLAVWNPFTGETRWIKPGKYGEQHPRIFVLGYFHDSKKQSTNYKILSFTFLRNKNPEMYEFNSDTWRSLDDDIAPGYEISGYTTKCMSLKGKSYWLVDDHELGNGVTSLLRFDFAKEKSEPVPLPYQRRDYEILNLSVVRDEKLSVLLKRDVESKIEIWVTNKIGDETKVTWSFVLALDLSSDVQITSLGSFVLDEEKKTVICCERWFEPEDERKYEDTIYIVGEDNQVTEFEVCGEEKSECEPAILTYVPSLVQIEEVGVGKRKRDD